jgi:hypothetical protein
MRAIRNTRGTTPTTWIGMPWDMEASMFEIDVTRNVNVDDPSTLVRVYTRLGENPEFRLRYADRVRRHCFNGGTLTPERTAAIWEARASEIFTAIIGESARWGDYRRPSLPFTRDAEWQEERNRLLTTYFPTRTRFLVNLLRQNGLYPDLDAPGFSPHGGVLLPGSEVAISSTTGAIYYTLDGSDPRESWTGNPVGAVYSGPLAMNESVTLKARALDNGEWSALTEAGFFVGNLAAAGNLLISEIMYNPPGASESLEYVELVNVSGVPIDLSGVSFGTGIDFAFPIGLTLDSGERVLVVNDQPAFEQHYGAGLRIAGEFQNASALDNGGEPVSLLATDGSEIEAIRYDDEFPWPESPDGLGPSLTRILRTPPNDPGDPASWRPSGVAGGSPGTSDATMFAGDPDADDNHNGLTNFVEYAIGNSLAVGTLVTGDGQFPTLTITRDLAADDVNVTMETSEDLITWEQGEAAAVVESAVHNGNGTVTITWRSIRPVDPARPGEFLRLRIEGGSAP